MDAEKFNKETVTKYWLAEAEEALKVADHLLISIKEIFAWIRSQLP